MKKEIQQSESRGKYFLAAFLAPLIWGFMSIAIRWVRDYPAEDILYYRILTALIILWSFILIFRRSVLQTDILHYQSLQPTEKRKVIWLTLLASVLILGNWFTYIYAVNHISIQSAAFAYLICPLLTAISAYIILKEQLSTIKKVALLFAMISVGMLASGSILEVIWSISIGLLYALYLIIQRVAQGFDKLNVLAVQLFICALFVIPKLIFNHNSIPDSPTFWITILIIAVLFTIIPLYLSMYALTKISSTTTGVLLYINPLIAFTLAVFYFKETVDPHKYIAYAIIVLAIILFNWQTIKRLSKK
ncbi:EamA family transporter [Sphingobacterium pedocola]|uniref:Permease n=1 Tax=Sphingobacterium pedocola TaxID=2082722 RepID=A0ABR9TCL6_9SPHI|nr:EamA family transporter [Sphingobacterium pedocola]MBE8722809.1 permease [Sphingobacterium pedocola]